MKKLILIIAVVFTGLGIQAQSLRSIANEYLQTYNKSYSKIMDTDYGRILVKFHAAQDRITEVRVTITIGSDIFDEITKRLDFQRMVYGKFTVDFWFINQTDPNFTLSTKTQSILNKNFKLNTDQDNNIHIWSKTSIINNEDIKHIYTLSKHSSIILHVLCE